MTYLGTLDIPEMKEGLRFGSEVFRQYVFCPRIHYYRRFLQKRPPLTAKMAVGLELHERAFLKSYVEKKGIKGADLSRDADGHELLYNVLLRGKRVPIEAQIDMLDLVRGKDRRLSVFELKTGKAQDVLPPHHRAQLLAQGIVAEEYFAAELEYIGAYYFHSKQIISKRVTVEDREWISKLIQELLEMDDLPILPDCEREGKCESCEYERLCWS